ncbi:MAG: hypothetical protein GKR89_02565 [Candidatus Latescibacteria bacterium]|nr:hypothetical protein [Candidatus Latescibacterota bacterium]
MLDTLRLGLIGVGGFSANYHIPRLLRRGDVEIAAICDPAAKPLAALQERLPGCAAFADYRQLVQVDGLDAVFVSSPNIYHFDQCRLALEKGLHLLVDKPLTMTAEQAANLVELAGAKDRVLMTAYTRHFMNSARHVRDQIVSGAMGSVHMITAVQLKNRTDRREQHGGIFLCRTVHMADLIPWLNQSPVTAVEAQIEYDGPYENWAALWLYLANGLRARLLCVADSEQFQDEITVYGAAQSFRLQKDQLAASDQRGDWIPVDLPPDQSNSTDHFVDVLLGNAQARAQSPTRLDGVDGLQALRVLEAAAQSSRTGQRVELENCPFATTH